MIRSQGSHETLLTLQYFQDSWQSHDILFSTTSEIRLFTSFLSFTSSVTVRVKNAIQTSSLLICVRIEEKFPCFLAPLRITPAGVKFIRISPSFTILLPLREKYPLWREIDEKYDYWITRVYHQFHELTAVTDCAIAKRRWDFLSRFLLMSGMYQTAEAARRSYSLRASTYFHGSRTVCTWCETDEGNEIGINNNLCLSFTVINTSSERFNKQNFCNSGKNYVSSRWLLYFKNFLPIKSIKNISLEHHSFLIKLTVIYCLSCRK